MSLFNLMDDYGNFITDWNYREIISLDRILSAKGIPHSLDKSADGWQLCYPTRDLDNRVVSVIEKSGSYGCEKDLLEIMGLLTPEEEQYDSVAGCLTAENVYYRIEKHWLEQEAENDAI